MGRGPRPGDGGSIAGVAAVDMCAPPGSRCASSCARRLAKIAPNRGDADRAADLAEERRRRRGHAEQTVLDRVLCSEHEHLHDHPQAEAEHDHVDRDVHVDVSTASRESRNMPTAVGAVPTMGKMR